MLLLVLPIFGMSSAIWFFLDRKSGCTESVDSQIANIFCQNNKKRMCEKIWHFTYSVSYFFDSGGFWDEINNLIEKV